MDIALTSDLESFVKKKVESGQYASADAVVHAGLRLLEQQQRDREEQLEQLRKEIATGLEQLDRGDRISGDVVFRELRQRNRQLQENAE